MNVVRKDTRGLQRLIGALAILDKGRAQVGIFSDATEREASGKTNAEIGAAHEFGSTLTNLPMRSWLRMPLMVELTPEKMRRIPWLQLLLRDGAKKLLKRLGILGEEVVQEGFATGGFGRWPALSAWTIRKKGSSAILIETAQLRKSVASRVVLP